MAKSYKDQTSSYIPAEEIDDVEDDELDTDFIDPRRSPQKMKQMALANQNNPYCKNRRLREFGKLQTNHVSKYRTIYQSSKKS